MCNILVSRDWLLRLWRVGDLTLYSINLGRGGRRGHTSQPRLIPSYSWFSFHVSRSRDWRCTWGSCRWSRQEGGGGREGRGAGSPATTGRAQVTADVRLRDAGWRTPSSTRPCPLGSSGGPSSLLISCSSSQCSWRRKTKALLSVSAVTKVILAK